MMTNVSDFTTCLSLNNRPCLIRHNFIGLNSNKYNQRLCYYPLLVNLDRCSGGCNTFIDPSDRIYVLNKTKDINLSELNESKTFIKHISCKFKCKLDGRKWNSSQRWNSNKSQCECKDLTKHHVCVKNHVFLKMENIEKVLFIMIQ